MCTRPKIAYRFTKDGKMKIRPFACDFVNELRESPMYKTGNLEYHIVPCGRCIECRLDYAKKWTIRLLNENAYCKNAYFITFTYDNEHLPKGLCKDHLKQFFHSLKVHYYRYNQKDKCEIKYFACGEYGETTFRPHYHAIIFNMPESFENELSIFFENDSIQYSKTGEKLYFSPTIKKLWGKGFIQVEKDLNYSAFRYVAGYIQKKQYGDNAKLLYKNNNILAPFLICSRGIGKDYYNNNKKWMVECDGDIIINNKKRAVQKLIPRYYLKLLEKESPKDFEKIKEHRHLLSDIFKDSLAALPYNEQLLYFRNRHEKMKDSEKRLVRNTIDVERPLIKSIRFRGVDFKLY